MYQGSNPTALQSQRWLTESLIALMNEKPFSQITIRDICRRADLSRQTFYNSFSSKEEILRSYLKEKCEAQFEKYSENCKLTVNEIVAAFSAVLTENRKLLDAMLKNELGGIINEAISNSVALFASRFVSGEKCNELLPYSEVLLSGALAQLLVFWFRQEKPISIEQLTSLLKDFLMGKLYDLNE